MKTLPRFACTFLAIASAAVAQGADSTPPAPQKGDPAPVPKVVHSYQEVLAQIPDDLQEAKPKSWTQLQREKVNAALTGTLVEKETPARLLLKVADIADWGGWTFYANVPNHEGYPIRVFGKFSDDWKEKFTALKKGDTVLLDGALSTIEYRDLWGKFTLSICLKNCTFTKVTSTNEPNIAL